MSNPRCNWHDSFPWVTHGIFPKLRLLPHDRCQLGKSKVVSHAFQGSWFNKWQWLHYESTTDLAFCHTCMTAIKMGKMKIAGNVKDPAFIYNGFCNWKDATRCFSGHEDSATQKTLWLHLRQLVMWERCSHQPLHHRNVPTESIL